MLMVTFTTIFEKPKDGDILANLIQLNLILIAMPYFSVIPINKILDNLIKDFPVELRPKIRPVWRYLKLIAGWTLAAIIMGGCIFIILVISANQTEQERISWLADFIFVFALDCFANPFVLVMIDFVFRSLVRKSRKKRKQQLIAQGKIVEGEPIQDPWYIRYIAMSLTIDDLNELHRRGDPAKGSKIPAISSAKVVPISGGSKDNKPPKIITSKVDDPSDLSLSKTPLGH